MYFKCPICKEEGELKIPFRASHIRLSKVRILCKCGYSVNFIEYLNSIFIYAGGKNESFYKSTYEK